MLSSCGPIRAGERQRNLAPEPESSASCAVCPVELLVFRSSGRSVVATLDPNRRKHTAAMKGQKSRDAYTRPDIPFCFRCCATAVRTGLFRSNPDKAAVPQHRMPGLQPCVPFFFLGARRLQLPQLLRQARASILGRTRSDVMLLLA